MKSFSVMTFYFYWNLLPTTHFLRFESRILSLGDKSGEYVACGTSSYTNLYILPLIFFPFLLKFARLSAYNGCQTKLYLTESLTVVV